MVGAERGEIELGTGAELRPAAARGCDVVARKRNALTGRVGDDQRRAIGVAVRSAHGIEQLGRAGEVGEDAQRAQRRQDEIDLATLVAGERVGRPHPLRLHELGVVVTTFLPGRRGRDEEPGVVPTRRALGGEPVREEMDVAGVEGEVVRGEQRGEVGASGVQLDSGVGERARKRSETASARRVDRAVIACPRQQQTGLFEGFAQRGDPDAQPAGVATEPGAGAGVVETDDPCRDSRIAVGGIDRTTGEDERSGREDRLRIAPEQEDVQIRTVVEEHQRCGLAYPFHGQSLRGQAPTSSRVRCVAVDRRRALPSVERVLSNLGETGLPRDLVAGCARDAVDAARDRAVAGSEETLSTVVADARMRVDAHHVAMLAPVVNATGVLLHTNLGRAPLGEVARAAMEVAGGYTNIEYRLDTGVRGSRQEHGGALVARACGAEAGLVVNNNAAAVLLVLAALARDRDVVVSRGELVEIGGGFRVPEILAETGAALVEVGTTNRTRRADYERACTDRTALLLKVHASNYRMVGFTESTPVAALASVGPPVVVDAGSGLLDERTPWLAQRPDWLGDEPGVRQCLDEGAALVTFSGDKLFGGPQAGVIVGRGDLVARLAQHPLARALRPDKVTLAGIETVAGHYLDGDGDAIPFWRLATTPLVVLEARAAAITARVAQATVVATDAAAGGGSVPGRDIPSVGVALSIPHLDDALARLRSARIIAIGRDGKVVCDLRTVEPADDDRLARALCALIAPDA